MSGQFVQQCGFRDYGRWLGAALATSFPFGSRWAVSPRMEWFSDADGPRTGVAQDIKEVTVAG